MIGVILAAGAGKRLTGSEVANPKCLAPFGGIPLIELQLNTMRWCGIEEIVVVVGFDGERVRRACGPGVRFVENPDYASTNSLYSLWLARAALRHGFVVMNCDVLFHPQLLTDLVTARHRNALLVSYPERGEVYGDEEMKVRLRRGRVVDIRKDLPLDETDGENVGIARFNGEGARALASIMEELVASGCTREWAPRAFREFACRRGDLFAIGTRGLPWTEIDTPEDYARAAGAVFPAIQHAIGDIVPALRRGA